MDSIKIICRELKKLENELKKNKITNKSGSQNTNKQIERCKSKKALERFNKMELKKFIKTHKLEVNDDCKKKLVKTVWDFINESDSDSSDSGSSSDESSSDDDYSSDDDC